MGNKRWIKREVKEEVLLIKALSYGNEKIEK